MSLIPQETHFRVINMGTSSARRAPTTALWRAAKAAATRYLSPEGGGGLNAREVVARYLAALEETPGQGDLLAVFRLTRKVGQELGAFWEEVRTRGWEKSLTDRGFRKLVTSNPSNLALGLAGVLVGGGGGLEEAVARTALAQVLRERMESEDNTAPEKLVRQFLGKGVILRLALDLGEPLENAANGYGRLKEGLDQVKQLIQINILEANDQATAPTSPEHWRGLTGWTWVTAMLAGLIKNIK